MQLPAIATTTIGSFPRPAWLAVSARTQVNFRLEGAVLKEAQDDATTLCMRNHVDLVVHGMHVIRHALLTKSAPRHRAQAARAEVASLPLATSLAPFKPLHQAGLTPMVNG